MTLRLRAWDKIEKKTVEVERIDFHAGEPRIVNGFSISRFELTAIDLKDEVLRRAAEMIQEEFCSHGGDHGPDVVGCYADFIYKALDRS